MEGTKLLNLLEQTWDSPVFGDAYPLSIAVGGTPILRRIEMMHAALVRQLHPILTEWMHPISPSHVTEIIRQIAPKSTAFCSAIAAGELEDGERLAQAGLTIALVYWADHRMDRGDLDMEAAILQRAGWTNAPIGDVHMVGLDAIERYIRAFSRRDDAAILIDNVLHEVLCREVRVRELSRLYQEHRSAEFWAEQAELIAEHTILDGALVYVTAAIYAIHRQHNPQLPSLEKILADPLVMRLMDGPAAAMIRVVDDLGDRLIDSGDRPEWGHFTLNIFNQPEPLWIEAFLKRADLAGPDTMQPLVRAFQSDDIESCEFIVQTFVDKVRAEFAALPAATYQANQLFLDIAKRVIEAGYVNAMGDIALSEP